MDVGIFTGSLLCAALKQRMATIYVSSRSQASDQDPNLVDNTRLQIFTDDSFVYG